MGRPLATPAAVIPGQVPAAAIPKPGVMMQPPTMVPPQMMQRPLAVPAQQIPGQYMMQRPPIAVPGQTLGKYL